MRISTPTRLIVLLTIFLLGAITTVSAQQTRGGSSTPPARAAQSQPGQPAAQPQIPDRNPYIADDEDPQRAEAIRAERQAAAKRTQDTNGGSITLPAFNQGASHD